MKLHVHGHRSSIHRPQLAWYWLDEARGYLAFTWGDRYGDPVWGIDLDVTVPRWLLRLDNRRGARRKTRT